MRLRRFAIALVEAALVLHPSGMRAQVLGVSVSPPSPVVDQPAIVTVTGQNPCDAVMIDFGSGGIVPTTHIASLPASVQHTWTTPGPKTVAAIGTGICTGHASQTIQVRQSDYLIQLCARIDCSGRQRMSSLKPQITALFGFNTPGGILAITGKNFGPKLGSVAASLRTWSGGSVQRRLEVIEWTDTMVGVRWPADISGVRHQSGALALTSANGKRDWRSVTFSPELEVRTLSRADVQVVSCGDDGNYDQCNRVQDDDDRVDLHGRPTEFESPIHAIVGMHVNDWGTVGNDQGIDTYRIALKNDWTLESFHWAVSVEAEQGWARKPTGFANAANWSPSVEWLVTPNDRVSYFAVLTVSGPVGVPYK